MNASVLHAGPRLSPVVLAVVVDGYSLSVEVGNFDLCYFAEHNIPSIASLADSSAKS